MSNLPAAIPAPSNLNQAELGEILTDKLKKVKTEQDLQDDNERREASAGITWDGGARQYRIQSQQGDDGSDDTAVEHQTRPHEKEESEPIFIEFEEGDKDNPFNWDRAKSTLCSTYAEVYS